MKFAAFALVTSELFVWSLLQIAAGTSEPVYQPECNSLNEAVQKIQDSLSQYQEFDIHINCSRNTACDGFSCVLTIQNQKTELNVKLHPCEDPPQMFVLVQDPDTNLPYIEETVTNGETFDIPGLHVEYLQLLRLSVALKVEFEKVSGGFQIGFNLEFDGGESIQSEVPLLPPTVINTPDCPTPGPEILQCLKMQELVASLTPPHGFNCTRNIDCKGFTCSGYIPIDPYSNTGIGITAVCILDSCTNPISYAISIQDDRGTTVWTHLFSHSESVFVDGEGVDLPPGVTANLNITMEPHTLDIDYLLTTIQLTLCIAQHCVPEKFVDSGLVPIPPCDHPLTTSSPGTSTSVAPLPGLSDECLTMQAVVTDIMNNPLFYDTQINCHTNGPCDGFVCNMNIGGHYYDISVKLYHCETPVRILFRIDDTEEGEYEYHIASNVTRNDVVSIGEIVPNGTVKFFLMRRSGISIELATTIEMLTPVGDAVSVPLVSDRLVTVAPCPTATSGQPGSSVTITFPPRISPTPVTVPGTLTKKPATPATPTKPGSKTQKPTKTSGNKSTYQQASSVSIGVGVGFAAVVAIVVIILALIWYRRRSHTSSDQMTLVENSSAAI